VPAAGYEIDFIKVRGIDRRNPLRAARPRSRRWRGRRRARALRRGGADVVMGGGGFVAGPAAWRAA
jgi:UDP-N-acetylglucosamine--N-acetylmuramyl-(pentapeptide) pyrophosphoryl-undecaprenol N-acetylglucosamine transferase